MKIKKEYREKFGEDELIVRITDLVEKANGSVLVEMGGTVVLVNSTMGKEDKDRDYFPLTVDFEEKFYSVGAILGGRFIKREGRPSEKAVLNARVIDRTIRPLFPKGFKNQIHVVATVLSIGKYSPETLSVLGASLSLSISDIPWNGPVSCIKCVKRENAWKNFATIEDSNVSVGEILVCGKDSLINMIEMEGSEIDEKDTEKGFELILKDIDKLQKFQEKVISENEVEKIAFNPTPLDKELISSFEKEIKPHLKKAMQDKNLDPIYEKWDEIVVKHTDDSQQRKLAEEYVYEQKDEALHSLALEDNTRVDGRGFDEIRSLSAKAGGISDTLHGTGIFYRGETHVLSVLTLGSPEDAQLIDTPEQRDYNKKFFHHYNFPPFASGETGRIGSPSRREIGHGALAEKALEKVLPPIDDFVYTIRLVSECFSSNGSTSMASVCASTLALLDGGVPISRPVAGIAMGLIQDKNKNIILTDIQGPEDHHGDMDLKVAGTEKGITAVQMDVKVEGISIGVFKEAIEKAREARLKILDVIKKEIAKPRSSLSENAPKIERLKINPSLIGKVIGTGGKVIKGIKEKTKVEDITIEDDGLIIISGSSESVSDALNEIKVLTKEFKIGEKFEGEVVGVVDFGVFVKIAEGVEGLVHISEISPKRVERIEDLISIGDFVPVVVKDIDAQGRIKLSIKQENPKFFDNK